MKYWHIRALYRKSNENQVVMNHNALADTEDGAIAHFFKKLYPNDLRMNFTLLKVEIAESKNWDEDIINLMVLHTEKLDFNAELNFTEVFNKDKL